MVFEKNAVGVMIVSSNTGISDMLINALPKNTFSPIISVSCAGEAKRTLVDKPVNIVIINTPLPDDFGVKLAMDISAESSCGILLLVKSELYELVSDRVEDVGILTLSKPTTKQLMFQSIKLLTATRYKLRALENQASTLQAKMEEIKIVNRAKLLLMERLKMSEADAHRYIEKTAMDKCVKRCEIAENIILTYGN